MGAFDGLRGDQISYGYWGNHTATIDWCETNYSHTKYIAEIVNTLTNVPSILLGIYGASSAIKNDLPKRYALCHLGGMLIGLGSFGFHTTLNWHWQLMDELPMIYVVSLACYLSLETNPGFKLRFGILGPVLVISWCIFVTFSYVYLPNPIYHQLAFAIILLTTIGRYLTLLSRLPKSTSSNVKSQPEISIPKSSASTKSSTTTTTTITQHASQLRSKIVSTMSQGIIIFALGFAIWNIDNIFCDYLTSFRENRLVPEIIGLLTHGHGWWHLMTGYGAFLINTSAICLQLAIKDSPDKWTYDAGAWFPVVQRRITEPQASSNGEPKPSSIGEKTGQ